VPSDAEMVTFGIEAAMLDKVFLATFIILDHLIAKRRINKMDFIPLTFSIISNLSPYLNDDVFTSGYNTIQS